MALDLTTLDPGTYDQIAGLSLEKQVVLRLVQEGFAVVAASEQPAILITVRRTPRGLLIEARGPGESKSREVEHAGERHGELHLEIAHKVV